MKQTITALLLLYILFCAIVPCFVFDNCSEDEHIAQTPGSKQEKDCNNCSPFAICSVAQGFTINSMTSSPAPIFFYQSPIYAEVDNFFQSQYSSGHFQPPRIG